MTTRALMSLALSAAMLGGSAVYALGGVAIASTRDEAAAAKAAAADADKATKALGKGPADQATRFAERAVGMQPTSPDYRVLLGQSYLKAGRFTSARAAFADALTLAPGNG